MGTTEQLTLTGQNDHNLKGQMMKGREKTTKEEKREARKKDTKEKLIIIEILGGCVVDVHGLPEGYLYTTLDHDE